MRRKFRFPKVDKTKVEKQFNYNEKIRSTEVFLINEEGENVGVMPTYKAIAMAQELGLDLVEVNPKAEIPVAKILDLGQFKYELDKKSLLGLREVLNNHTYSHRMRTILDTLDIENNLLVKEGVSIITATKRPQSLDNILNNYLGQCYEKKELIIIINNNKVNLVEWEKIIGFHDDIKIFKLDEKYTLGECLNYAVRNSKYNYISNAFVNKKVYHPAN